MVFGLFWIVAFIQYKTKFIVQVSAASYYYDSKPDETGKIIEGSASVCLGFKFAYLNHIGSLAIGAFIIGVLRLAKIIFVYAARRAEQVTGENGAAKALAKCGACYISCLEKVCDYMNESAYAYMAVAGGSYFGCAWDGFLLNIKHMLGFSFSNFLAKCLIFVGKIGITVGNVFSLLFIMGSITGDMKEVSSVWGPCVVVALWTYFTASVFLGLFDTAVMAMMTSRCIDIDVHNGTAKFGPPTFHASADNIKAKREEWEQKQRDKKQAN